MDILNRTITYVVNPLVDLLIGLAVIYFLYGVFNFVRNAENPEKRIEGAKHILWGVVGIAIMFSVFTFTRIIKNTIGTSPGNVYDDAYPASLK
jgi:Type IV secretion system pilin